MNWLGSEPIEKAPAAPKGTMLTLESEKLSTPEWCFEEITDIISFIQEKYKIWQVHLLRFNVNWQIIEIWFWSRHGFVRNEYNIPRLCMCIYDRLTPEQQQNFQTAFAKIEANSIGVEPDEGTEEILRWIKFYLNRKLWQAQ